MSRYEETPAIAETVGAGGDLVFEFRSTYPVAQCVGVSVAFVAGAPLFVASVKVGGVEQLLGDGVPAEFFGIGVLVFEPQRSGSVLTVTLKNEGSEPIDAGVCVAFVEVPNAAAHAEKVWS